MWVRPLLLSLSAMEMLAGLCLIKWSLKRRQQQPSLSIPVPSSKPSSTSSTTSISGVQGPSSTHTVKAAFEDFSLVTFETKKMLAPSEAEKVVVTMTYPVLGNGMISLMRKEQQLLLGNQSPGYVEAIDLLLKAAGSEKMVGWPLEYKLGELMIVNDNLQSPKDAAKWFKRALELSY